jgi:protease I
MPKEDAMAKIAMVLGQDFEDSEAEVPLDRLRAAGHEVTIVGAKAGETLRGKRGKEQLTADVASEDAKPTSFDAMVIPGGFSPDHLRIVPEVVAFVRDFARTGKPVAAVCHGPQLLIEADLVKGKRLTSWPSVRKDLENAGATWVDEQVVRDGALITSRNPGDLEAFSKALVDTLARKEEHPSARA